jgi:hypothetical protein
LGCGKMEKKANPKGKTVGKPQPINEEAQRGVWVDGIGLGLSSDYVILEGIITPPRAEKPYIAARIMFPPRLLEHLAKNLKEAVKQQKALKPPKVGVKVEK